MSKATLPLILLLAFLACNPSPLPQTPQPLKPTPTTPATLPPTNTPTLTPSPSPTPTPSATNTASPQPTATVTATEAATIAPSVIFAPFTATPAATVTMTAKEAQIAEYEALFKKVAKRFNFNPDLLAKLGYRESGWNPEAVGQDCELGLMQIHCITWGYLITKIGIENPDPFNPEHNVLAAGYLLDEIKGDCERWGDPSEGCMLATYACGQGCMAKFYFGGGGSWENSQMAREVGKSLKEVGN